jgi:hypothetical protein
MKALLIGVTLAGLVGVGTAHAIERVMLSKEIVGTWCYSSKAGNVWRYRREANPLKNRAPCKGVEWMEIKQDGYEGPEFGCKSIEGRVVYSNLPKYPTEMYSISYRCSGEGSAWSEKCDLSRVDNELLVECKKGK